MYFDDPTRPLVAETSPDAEGGYNAAVVDGPRRGPMDEGSLEVDLGPARPGSEELDHQVMKGNLLRRLFPSEATAPSTIGHFELLHQVGAGGMGVVYAARDVRLDRKVAIKLLHATMSRHPEARERLLREARALARVSHPNVVQIHESGTHGDQVFIVMEFVEGITLRGWLRDRTPSTPRRRWDEVLPLMLQAGRGLAAAHEAGLTHRDFKPDNVLIGRDGRVRVVDFGLARPEVEEAGSSQTMTVELSGTTNASSSATSGSAHLDVLTKTGTVMGTLPYMAPELLDAKPADARSDQFAFCVTLYEALHGIRPFAGRTITTLTTAIENGELQHPDSPPSLPRWLRSAVLQGLAPDPNERFADMPALLRVLDRPRRRYWPLLGALAVGASSTATVASLGPDRAPEPCIEADAELAAQWTDDTRDRVRAGMLATASPDAEATAERALAGLDDTVQRWRDALVETCEATHVRHTQSDELLGRRMACIDRSLQPLHATIDGLQHADAGLVEHAVEAVARLSTPVVCEDDEALLLGPPAPEDPEAVAGLRRRLAEAELLALAGHEDQASTIAEQILEQAATVGYAPLHSEALYHAARLQARRRTPADVEQATIRLWEGLDLAEPLRHDRMVVDTWLVLAELEGVAGRPQQGLRFVRRALALSQRMPMTVSLHGELALRQAVLYLQLGEAQTAVELLRGALVTVGEGDPNAPATTLVEAQLWATLATALGPGPNREEIGEAHRRAVELHRQTLGDEHPHVAHDHFEHARFLIEQGQVSEARALLLRASEIWRRSHGEDYLEVGRVHLALADLDQQQGDLEAAAEHARRGREIYEHALAPDHPSQAEPLLLLGLVEFRRQHHVEALEAWEAAQRLQSATLGDAHPQTLMTRSNAGEALLELGQTERALAVFEALTPQVMALDSRDLVLEALVLKGLGLAHLAQGEQESSCAALEQAQQRLGSIPGLALEHADVLWALARSCPGDGGRERAERAAALYRTHGQPQRATTIDAWIHASIHER